MGTIGWGVASGWWRAIWPRAVRGEYCGSFGFEAARLVRGLVFVFVFLPIVGPFALLTMLLLQLINVLFMPVRFLRRLCAYGQA